MKWSDKTVLVTGADGFLGSHLCDALVERGANVVALVRPSSRAVSSSGWSLRNIAHLENRITIVWGDVRNAFSVLKAMRNVNIVYHLAAQSHVALSWEYPVETVETNILGSLNVLESARREGVGQAIYLGSDKEYGQPKYLPLDEDHPLLISSPYATSKIFGDMLFNMYLKDYNLPTIVTRMSNVYGPRQSEEKVIPSFILCLLRGKKPRINLVNKNETPARDFVFISDVIQALLAIGEQKEKCIGEILNFGSGEATRIDDLALLIIQMMGLEIEPEYCELTSQDIPTEKVNFDKAKRLLGWKPLVTLEEGLKQTIEWYKSNYPLNIGFSSPFKSTN